MPTLFVPREPNPAETRVAATPSSVKTLVERGLTVILEAGAGRGAHIPDDAYIDAGARITDQPAEAYAEANLVAQIGVPHLPQIDAMRRGSSMVSFVWAHDRLELVRHMVERDISVFAMDAIPRITRAQKDDARSSQANLAGYRAVIVAAEKLPRIFPMMMTAAGTIRPAKVVIVGAGVAGLQAIATARRLGAIVEVSDVRPEVKEQVESLGATYIDVAGLNAVGEGGYAGEQTTAQKALQQKALDTHLVAADVIVCTALIPYRSAPVLVSESVVERMKSGSVIVDLAAERGGNCACTRPGEIVIRHGVTCVGTLNLPGQVPVHASEMYANNIRNILLDGMDDGSFRWNLDDDIVAGALICHRGEVRDTRLREALDSIPAREPSP